MYTTYYLCNTLDKKLNPSAVKVGSGEIKFCFFKKVN